MDVADVAAPFDSSSMTEEEALRAILAYYGFSIVFFSWDDNGREKMTPGVPFSGVFGPCIADSTVSYRDASGRIVHCHIVRPENFRDWTADRPESCFLLPTRRKDGVMVNVPLATYLSDNTYVGGCMDGPLARPGEHVLCSAQACVIPVGEDGKSRQFFLTTDTYGSELLVLVVSYMGTSPHFVEGGKRGLTTLLHQEDGKTFEFLATKSSVARPVARPGTGGGGSGAGAGGGGAEPPAAKVGGDDSYGADTMLFVFQIPLKREVVRKSRGCDSDSDGDGDGDVPRCIGRGGRVRRQRQTEVAWVSAGSQVGIASTIPSTRKLVRNFDYPIRCTMQLYNIGPAPGTSKAPISSADVRFFGPNIKLMYDGAAAVGSLVTGDGDKGRLTEAAPEALAAFAASRTQFLASFLPGFVAPGATATATATAGLGAGLGAGMGVGTAGDSMDD